MLEKIRFLWEWDLTMFSLCVSLPSLTRKNRFSFRILHIPSTKYGQIFTGFHTNARRLDENFHIIKEDYYPENGGVIFPNPNAPTSIYEDLEFVEDIIRHNQDVIVIVDEAYIDFAGESALSLLDKYDNLIITQTFSKARSMAGMRIGYAIASRS